MIFTEAFKYHVPNYDVFKDVRIIVRTTRSHCASWKVKVGHTKPIISYRILGEETGASMTAAAPLRF